MDTKSKQITNLRERLTAKINAEIDSVTARCPETGARAWYLSGMTMLLEHAEQFKSYRGLSQIDDELTLAMMGCK